MKFNHMRIARPVQNLEKSLQMYCLGLGLKKMGDFVDHDGFSGVILGDQGLAWHLEFTQCLKHPILPQATLDDLLVLYIPNQVDWEHSCEKMLQVGFVVVESFNPYWDVNGQTFMDGDGYRTVLQNQQWEIDNQL